MRSLPWFMPASLIILLSNSTLSQTIPDCFKSKKAASGMIALTQCRITSESIGQFDEYLNTQKEMISFSLMQVEIKPEIASSLSVMLANHNNIDRVWVVQSNFDSAAIEKLARSKSLIALDISGNKIDDRGIMALSKNQSITNLDLEEEGVSIKAIIHFLDAHPLRGLGLFGYALGNDGFNKLIQHINKKQIRSLLITDKTIQNISKITELNKLESLSLSAAYSFDASPIWTLSELRVLYLRHAYIDEAKQADFSALKKLTILYFQHCEIHQSSPLNFANMHQLQTVRILSQYRGIGDKAAITLAALPNLESLELVNQHLSDNAAVAFSKNQHIRFLNLGNNKIGDKGALALANTPSLRSLSLRNNIVGDAAGIQLAHRENINYLDLSWNLLTDLTANEFAGFGANKFLFINNNKFSQEAIAILKKNKNIEKLYVDDEYPDPS